MGWADAFIMTFLMALTLTGGLLLFIEADREVQPETDRKGD